MVHYTDFGTTRRPLGTIASWSLVLSLAVASTASSAVLRVNPDGTGDFLAIQAALDEADPGDEIVVAAATYSESLVTRRDGLAEAPITLRAEPGAIVVVTTAGRVLDVQHAHQTVESLTFDSQFGAQDAIRVGSGGDFFELKGSEVRNSGRDCVDMGSPIGVRIEDSNIHHCLFWDGERVDAHGVTGDGVQDLVVRNTVINFFSGDAVQFAPNRVFWDNVTLENCEFRNDPLPVATAGFPAGQRTGENGIDTKTPATGARPRMVVRNLEFSGFRDVIGNQGALNLKENVEVIVDRVTISDSELGFRLRDPAKVTIVNCVLHDLDKGVRYEDGIDQLEILNCTFGSRVEQSFQDVGGSPVVLNSLFLAAAKPSEASDSSNRTAIAADFINVTANDYHLTEGASAIEAGLALAQASTDRDGVLRPQGAGFDVGAYEFLGPQLPAAPSNLAVQPDG